MGVFSELKRRNVLRMAVLYAAAAWFIMQVAEVVFGLVGLPEQFGRALLIVLAVGFPIALAISWFYEFTPEGLALDAGVAASEFVTPFGGRRIDFVIIAVLAAAVLLFAYDKWWTGSPPEQSVAVLPFVAMSSGEDDGYFADGLTEEILNSLAQLPELRVTARTSSFFFKGKDVSMAEIADILNVAHIVEGSVRRDGERLRITSQLIRVEDGFHLWSKTYDRTSEDIFATQNDIAEKVAEALNVALDDEARERMRAIRINDIEAFVNYQKGLELFEKAHDRRSSMIEDLAIANTFFDKAIEAQPDLVAARVLRADRAVHVAQEMTAREEPDIDKVRDQVEAARTDIERAWRASPRGNQRDILDLERTLFSDDWTGLEVLIQKAMQTGDCPTINLAETIANLGFAQELAKKLEESLACNPLDADVIFRLTKVYSIAGRPNEALELLERPQASGVNSVRFRTARNYALFVAGRFSDLEIQSNWNRDFFQHLIQGTEVEARQMAEQIWNRPDTDTVLFLRFALWLGDRARANEFAARIDKYPGSARLLIWTFGDCKIFSRLVTAKGCRQGIPFDLEATPNLKARIEESGLQWPSAALR